MKKKRFILGVCGKIGSGKSEVLKILSKKGWLTVDADKIVHNLYEPGKEGQRRICDFFGEEFIKKDGSVDRKLLGKVVFTNLKKLKILNALIHPLVFNEIGKILDANKSFSKIAVEAVYFDEKFLQKITDKILLVSRSKEDMRKVLLRRKVNSKLIGKILALDTLPKKIDLKILNNSTLKALEKKVIMALWSNWKP